MRKWLWSESKGGGKKISRLLGGIAEHREQSDALFHPLNPTVPVVNFSDPSLRQIFPNVTSQLLSQFFISTRGGALFWTMAFRTASADASAEERTRGISSGSTPCLPKSALRRILRRRDERRLWENSARKSAAAMRNGSRFSPFISSMHFNRPGASSARGQRASDFQIYSYRGMNSETAETFLQKRSAEITFPAPRKNNRTEST